MTGDRRQRHHNEVIAYLQAEFPGGKWALSLPPSGRGHESYVAVRGGDSLFVKLGARLRPYQILATAGVTPPVASAGHLDDGTAILVQVFVPGRIPSWSDFHCHLERFAAVLHTTHCHQELQRDLPLVPSASYRDLGLAALARLRRRWLPYRAQVPSVTAEVDENLARLEEEMAAFGGAGPVASHNDPCNGNWLITASGTLYLLDLDAMTLDDPAHDLGALLWWYYPSHLRPRFLTAAGYDDHAALSRRMRARMALHCLDILLPRANSFDAFDPAAFPAALRDFRAVVQGKENPHGYED